MVPESPVDQKQNDTDRWTGLCGYPTSNLKGPLGSINYSILQLHLASLPSEIALDMSVLNAGKERQVRYITWITRIVYLNNHNPPGPELLGMKLNQHRFQSQLRHSGLHRGLCSPFRSLGCPGAPPRATRTGHIAARCCCSSCKLLFRLHGKTDWRASHEICFLQIFLKVKKINIFLLLLLKFWVTLVKRREIGGGKKDSSPLGKKRGDENSGFKWNILTNSQI